MQYAASPFRFRDVALPLPGYSVRSFESPSSRCSMIPAILILSVIGAYFAIGLIFGLWFVTAGLSRFDSAADQSTWSFRVLILPGCMALWPLLALRIRSRHKEAKQ